MFLHITPDFNNSSHSICAVRENNSHPSILILINMINNDVLSVLNSLLDCIVLFLYSGISKVTLQHSQIYFVQRNDLKKMSSNTIFMKFSALKAEMNIVPSSYHFHKILCLRFLKSQI